MQEQDYKPVTSEHHPACIKNTYIPFIENFLFTLYLCYKELDKRKLRTKIYGTLGPKCADSDTLRKMVDLGMTGVRLNLSHQPLIKSKDYLDAWQDASQGKGDLLVDLQGPEMRMGDIDGRRNPKYRPPSTRTNGRPRNGYRNKIHS